MKEIKEKEKKLKRNTKIDKPNIESTFIEVGPFQNIVIAKNRQDKTKISISVPSVVRDSGITLYQAIKMADAILKTVRKIETEEII